MKLEEIEKKITDTCEKAVAAGWTICKFVTYDRASKRCCALGATMALDESLEASYLAKAPKRDFNLTPVHIANTEYGMNVADTTSFIEGFDFGKKVNLETEPSTFQIGVRVSKRFVK